MNSIKVAFFTEAGTNKGMGHLVRSYCIYKEFLKDCKAFFYLDSDIDFSCKFNGIIEFKWSDFHLNEKFDIIFIDSYIASKEIYEKIEKSCKVAIYLDDFGRIDYPKGIILNFAPDASELFFKEKKVDNIYLLGPTYVPIREDFLNQKTNKKDQLFVSFGGSTDDEVYLKTLDALKDINIKKIVVSSSKTLADKIAFYKDIDFLNNPSNSELIEKMASSILAITTASMTVYELSFFKIPNIVIALSQNQFIGSSQLIKHKLSNYYVPIFAEEYKVKINKYVQELLKGSSVSSVVDGNGTKRIKNESLKVLKI